MTATPNTRVFLDTRGIGVVGASGRIISFYRVQVVIEASAGLGNWAPLQTNLLVQAAAQRH